MPEYADIYVLVKSRDIQTIVGALDKYAPQREPCSDEFWVHEDEDGICFEILEDALAYLSVHSRAISSLYFRNLNPYDFNEIMMLFYTDDGKVIFGICRVAKQLDERHVLNTLNRLKVDFDSQLGCIANEEPAPNNAVQFIDFCKIWISE